MLAYQRTRDLTGSRRLSTDLDFVIIGAQKGGSTLIARGVGQHPQVWMPLDEVPLFRDPIYSPSELRRFRSVLAEQPARMLRGIKCPDYLARAEVAPRLLEQERRPKLVACLRDPISRAVSTYFWHVRWGLLPVEDASVGLRKVLDGAYRGRNPRVDEILDWGLYGKHLAHFLEYFNRSEIRILFNDALSEAPAQSFREVFAFLGVDENFRPAMPARRVNEGVYSTARLRFLNLRNRFVVEWNNDRTYVNIRRASGLGPRLVSTAVAGVDRYLLARMFPNDKPILSLDVMRRLRDFYRPDVQLLESILGRELSSWR
jgi:hypothetical protein